MLSLAVCSFFWQLTVEGVAINGFSALGACIVTGSVVSLGVRKWFKDKQLVAAMTAPVADAKPVDVEAAPAMKLVAIHDAPLSPKDVQKASPSRSGLR